MAKNKKNTKWTGQDFKRARRAAESLYYYRYNKIGEKGPLKQCFRGLIQTSKAEAAEVQLANTPCFWHCVSISYFVDPWGKQYRRWGFAKTQEQLRIIKQPLDPLLLAAQQAAESDANSKQLVARSFILAPWNKRHNDIYPLVKKHAKDLDLTQEDLDGIKDYLDEDFEIYEYDVEDGESPEDRNDVDKQIAKYL